MVIARVEVINYQQSIETIVWQLFSELDSMHPASNFRAVRRTLFNFPTPLNWSAWAIYALFVAELHSWSRSNCNQLVLMKYFPTDWYLFQIYRDVIRLSPL